MFRLNRNKQKTNRNSLIGSIFCYFLQKICLQLALHPRLAPDHPLPPPCFVLPTSQTPPHWEGGITACEILSYYRLWVGGFFAARGQLIDPLRLRPPLYTHTQTYDSSHFHIAGVPPFPPPHPRVSGISEFRFSNSGKHILPHAENLGFFRFFRNREFRCFETNRRPTQTV